MCCQDRASASSGALQGAAENSLRTRAAKNSDGQGSEVCSSRASQRFRNSDSQSLVLSQLERIFIFAGHPEKLRVAPIPHMPCIFRRSVRLPTSAHRGIECISLGDVNQVEHVAANT